MSGQPVSGARVAFEEAATLYQEGVLLRTQDRLEEAAQAHLRALQLQPNFPEAEYELGLIHRLQGNLPAAEAHQQRALALKSNFAEAHLELALVLRAEGRYGEAGACFERAWLLKPQLADAARELARAGWTPPRAMPARLVRNLRFLGGRVAARFRGHELHLEEVRGWMGANQLRSEWTALWERCPRASPFLHPDWLLHWCEPFGVWDPWLVCIRSSGKLVSCGPFYVQQRNGVRTLSLLGSGLSDYQDVLVEPGWEQLAGPALITYLQADQGWERAEFARLPADSPLLSGGARAVDRNCPVLQLPRRAEDLLRLVSPRLRRSLGYRARAEEAGLDVQRSWEPGAPALDVLFNDFLALHTARFERRPGGEVIGAGLAKFLHRVVDSFSRLGLLRLCILRIGGAPAAAFLGFACKGRWYFYMGGFDPRLSRFRPGHLVMHDAIQQAIREGAEEFDFLRGGEPYKYEWGAQDRLTFIRRWERV